MLRHPVNRLRSSSLSSDTHGAVICVANPRHNAALRNHGDRAEAIPSAPSMPHYYIPAALEATIDAQKRERNLFSINTDAPLTPTPRGPACLIEGERRGTRTAMTTRNLDDISICFATPAATVPIPISLPASPIPALWD